MGPKTPEDMGSQSASCPIDLDFNDDNNPEQTIPFHLEDALTIVDEKLRALHDTPFAKRLQRVVESHLESLDVRVNDLPETVLVHSLSPPDAPPDPSAAVHEVPVRAGAEVTFDVLFFDQLRSAAQHVVDVLTDEIDRAGQIREVLHFGHDAAKDDNVGSDAATPSRRLS